ncbi:MAG: RNA-2',3'-PO4:RNA-5'-OH ligase [uncultured Solirubrobacteraceae bacterium]|uniref:3'-phosphate/5'-hydroxy nucleic acid ligase n=1 Tax=uncultured Solirubrobacteraceae bacterium TaxID=1162706 RepID=A0A6J4U053_9ACTN|nr:MAG: RNA-2',3'-PO4:RNA-5'-OH ligase [uncultured Solirubrobacteraceae bacterium]
MPHVTRHPTEDIVVFGEHEPKVIDQIVRCVRAEDGARGVLAADGHFGYSAPIGANLAYREHVSPAAVGYDIGCGNLAVRTDLREDDLRPSLAPVMDRIFSEVSFGMGRNDGTAGDHPVIDRIRSEGVPIQRELRKTAAKQLGTVGAGNHYVDLFGDENGDVWVGVHFGSRGFGHRTATHYLDVAAREGGRPAKYAGGSGEMEAPPDLLRVGTAAGDEYLAAMRLAGDYAYAGREVVVAQVLGILGARELDQVHNHHNFAWREEHDGEPYFVVRKGATPAFPGQRGFVGASMGEPAVILEGVDSELSASALYSTVHGAGRAMSRTAAAGKSIRKWTCTNRDCDWTQPPRTRKPAACPVCGHGKLAKRLVRLKEGSIDWAATTADLRAQGIELRGANAEEAPGAYKRLDAVLAEHEGTIRILHTLRPLGVAMAPGDVQDPYKD